MSRSRPKVDDFIARHPVLQADETVTATARAMPKGGIKAWSKRVGKAARFGGAGMAFVLAKDSLSSDASYEKAAEKGVYLVLTGSRLIVLDSSAFGAKPERVIATVERSRIVEVTEGVTKVGLFKLLNLTIALDDDTEVGFEFAKPDTVDGRTLLAAIC